MHEPLTTQEICSICYTKGITFSKSKAMLFVGGRNRLEELVAQGKIRVEKTSNAQNAKWQCSAGDVLFYAKRK